MANHLSRYIFGALILGAFCGAALHDWATPAIRDAGIQAANIAGTMFLRLIKMIIGPLVFATLVAGVAHAGERGSVVRIGVKAMIWFIVASVLSLCIGTAMALALRPGAALHIDLPAATAETGLKGVPSLEKTLTEAVPASFFEAMSDNSILPIVVFSLFVGFALSALGSRGDVLVRAVDALTALMLTITSYVMLLAPVGVFAAVSGAIATNGLEILRAFSVLLASFYAALTILMVLLLLAGWLMLGRRLPRLLTLLRGPALLAFSTTSSEAAFPKVLEATTRFGASPEVAGFVLPLGYSFNLDASIMYCAFGALFVVQAYGVQLDGGQIAFMMLLLFLTSKGIAAVPRGALIAIAATLPHFNVPEAGILLLLGVDHFMNMGRSVANVLGNALAVVAVAKWEGALSSDEFECEDEEVVGYPADIRP